MKQTDLNPILRDFETLPRSTTLFQESGLRALLLHLKAGESIPEHRTKGSITVHCLKGEVTFNAGEERVPLTPGILINLAPDSPHGLTAQQDSLLLVTLAAQS